MSDERKHEIRRQVRFLEGNPGSDGALRVDIDRPEHCK